ncbi:uncharacterized oxidoreductase YjmC-like [Ischnura elegans]|uniref:uncharacterized oxidoreductase YjmC-like n=1 Tax=Ischnura elegans TaxID=197161 RepID=UPI001ED8A396|nr:uncharacterized oxidoreductase YjmC-like [Ischnura elegans]
MSTKGCLIPLNEIRRFITDSMVSAGAPKAHAAMMGDVLALADYRGHFSHGLNRLEMYVKDVRTKSTDAFATPVVVQEKSAMALVDGKNGLGPVVGNFCMDLAIKKAADTGVGWVSARGSNHYGIAGWYSLRAMAKGFMGLSFTNSSPLVSPTRSKAAALGTNPITLAAPGVNGDSFVLDMATSTVAVGKIELQQRKREPLPVGWALDKQGHITTDADKAMEANCLMPLGGAEETSGYKGTGLGLLVEIFCGILSGSKYGPFVRNWKHTTENANLGQCFIALDYKAFGSGFEERLTHLLSTIRAMEPADPEKEVIVPGDPEKWHMKCVNEDGGITYHRNQIDALIKLAEELKIEPMKAIN